MKNAVYVVNKARVTDISLDYLASHSLLLPTVLCTFYPMSILGVRKTDRQTDRQTDQ